MKKPTVPHNPTPPLVYENVPLGYLVLQTGTPNEYCYLKDFKATLHDHVVVTTTNRELAARLPQGQVRAIAKYIAAQDDCACFCPAFGVGVGFFRPNETLEETMARVLPDCYKP